MFQDEIPTLSSLTIHIIKYIIHIGGEDEDEYRNR